MNYLKKIKEIGFRRINNYIVPYFYNYSDPSRYGYLILDISDDLLKNNKDTKGEFEREYQISLSNYRKIVTFKYKVSDNINIYLVIINLSYFCVYVEDTYNKLTMDSKYSFSKQVSYTNNIIKVFEYPMKLDDKFWLKIKENLDLSVKRQIILKEIC